MRYELFPCSVRSSQILYVTPLEQFSLASQTHFRKRKWVWLARLGAVMVKRVFQEVSRRITYVLGGRGHCCMAIDNIETSQAFMLLLLVIRLYTSLISYWSSCSSRLLHSRTKASCALGYNGGRKPETLLCLRVAVATDNYDPFSSCSLRFPNKRSCSLSICQLRALVTVHKEYSNKE